MTSDKPGAKLILVLILYSHMIARSYHTSFRLLDHIQGLKNYTFFGFGLLFYHVYWLLGSFNKTNDPTRIFLLLSVCPHIIFLDTGADYNHYLYCQLDFLRVHLWWLRLKSERSSKSYKTLNRSSFWNNSSYCFIRYQEYLTWPSGQ